jgi:glycerophosphoryl diester phosphodiesterase
VELAPIGRAFIGFASKFGASSVAPENTLAAVKQAIEDGADWVEIDVQETADGEVVVTHDSDFMKQAGVEKKFGAQRRPI